MCGNVWGGVKCSVGEHRGGGDRQLDISINLNMLERGGGTLRARDHQHPGRYRIQRGVLVLFIPAQCPQLQGGQVTPGCNYDELMSPIVSKLHA